MKKSEVPIKLDRPTLLEICRRFEGMAQPNSLSVVILAEGMLKEKRWDQETLEALVTAGQTESEQGPNQRITGWPHFFRQLASANDF